MKVSTRTTGTAGLPTLRSVLLGCLFAVGACAAATSEPTGPGSHRRDGDLSIAASPRESGETIRWEKGALTHGGTVTAFTVKGLDIGGWGFEGLVVVGEVYDLDRPQDFAGTYQRVLADVTRAGPGAALLGNEHGVLLVLRSADGESPVAPAPEGMVVELAP